MSISLASKPLALFAGLGLLAAGLPAHAGAVEVLVRTGQPHIVGYSYAPRYGHTPGVIYRHHEPLPGRGWRGSWGDHRHDHHPHRYGHERHAHGARHRHDHPRHRVWRDDRRHGYGYRDRRR